LEAKEDLLEAERDKWDEERERAVESQRRLEEERSAVQVTLWETKAELTAAQTEIRLLKDQLEAQTKAPASSALSGIDKVALESLSDQIAALAKEQAAARVRITPSPSF